MTCSEPRAEALDTLLKPGSVAVIGAGDDPTTFSGAPIFNLRSFGYRGGLYAVNPGRSEIQGVPCYSSITEVPGPVDSAIITVPARFVLDVLRQCIDKGVASATLVTSGFAEGAAGEEGQERAAQLDALLRSSSLRLLGPNTAGLLNLFDDYVPRAAHNHLPADRVRLGSVALVSQSGACSNILFNRAQSHGVGVSLSIATGDQADIDVWDITDYCVADRRISVVMLIVESFGNVDKARIVARRAVDAMKPIVMLKVGQSAIGGAVAQAHSGAVAGNAAVESAAMREFGIVEVSDLDELWEVARLVEGWGAPPSTPVRLGVVSVSGGEAALIADHCERNGIELPAASDKFVRFIDEAFSYAEGANPFDPTGEVVSRPEKLEEGVGAFIELNDFTHLLVASPVFGAELAARYYAGLPRALDAVTANVLLTAWPAGDFTAAQLKTLSGTGQPVLPNSARAMRALGLYQACGLRYGEIAAASSSAPPATSATLTSPAEDLRYWDSRTILEEELGLKFVRASLCASAEEARKAAGVLGGPVVLKANVPSGVHKADHGLIEFQDGTDSVAIGAAFDRLTSAAAPWGTSAVAVEGFAAGQTQLLLGAHRDAEFGPVVLFGSGGGPVEYLDDVAILLAGSASMANAHQLISRTRIGRYLVAKKPGLAEEIAGALTALAGFMVANERCESVDVNPCIVDLLTETWACADARIV
jgi:acyl-CoA synthetase (NDP forming)